MRKIVVTTFLSLDGVMEEPGWTFPYWNDEISGFKAEEDETTDMLLLGRVTYEGFAAAWPESEDEGAERINTMPKYVVSTTLNKAEWQNSHILQGDPIEAIKKLKQQEGKDILVYGSATLVRTLMENDLVDSYRLLLYPVVLGRGKRLFSDDVAATLRHVQTQTFSNGVVGLVYEPARD